VSCTCRCGRTRPPSPSRRRRRCTADGCRNRRSPLSPSMPSLRLEEDGGAGEVDVRRERAEDDAVDVAWRRRRRPRARLLRRLEGQIARAGVAVVGDVATLLDAGARADPRVVRLRLRHGLADVLVVEERDLLVGDDAFRDVRADAEDLRAQHPPGLPARHRGAKRDQGARPAKEAPFRAAAGSGRAGR
jgi:hypothetical protein